MKPFNIKQLMELDFIIPNLHPDFRFVEAQRRNWDGQNYTVFDLQVKRSRVAESLAAEGYNVRDEEWLSLIIMSKRTGRVVDDYRHIMQMAGLVTKRDYDATTGAIDALYYLSNPPTLRLLNGKLRKGIYREVARRVRSRIVKYSVFTDLLLQTVIEETKRLNPTFNNQDVADYLRRNYGIEKLFECHLTNKLYMETFLRRDPFGNDYKYYHYKLNPTEFNYTVYTRDNGINIWLHNTEIWYRGRAYQRDTLTMQHCPECDQNAPAEGFEDGVCWHCLQERYKIHSYSTKAPSLLKFKAKNVKPSTLYLGIELEYETRDKDVARVKVGKQLAGHAIMKSDGSIRNGFEIVTCPATLEIHREEFKKFYDNLPGELFAASNTGMHVHVSRKPLNLFTIGKMTEFVNRLDNKKFIAYVAGRIDNSYAQQDRHRTVTYPLVNKRGGERYNALNLNPTDTVEFRIFSTPTNWEQFASRLEFCQALTDYCQPAQTSTSLKHMTHYSSFINWLKSHHKDYPELSNHLKGFA
jgi:hypothetical protein